VTASTSRWRLAVGIVSFVAAAVVGIVGYLKLSLESSLNHQIPYLASAGMALVLLSAIGVALVIADQIHVDETRMEELTSAIERLAEAIAPDIERPARRREPDSASD
jgi:hypothetical protein